MTLHDAIRARGERDARAFREQHPSEQPNEKWLENSFTAALPLAKHDAGTDADPAVDAELFAAYKSAVTAALGMTRAPRPASERDLASAPGEVQEPTPGEG
jgi:DNA-binding transcriptional LysR family regulator